MVVIQSVGKAAIMVSNSVVVRESVSSVRSSVIAVAGSKPGITS